MKRLITAYTFDASAKTISFDDYASINLERVLLITNATDQIIIYNFADTAKGGTVSTNVLTLDHNTTAMDDADKLLIYYDDPAYDAATAAKQPALGTAGSPSADVITVQGIASMTPIKTDASATTQPISAASLPLPTGAATSAKQDTGNTSLASIDSKITAVNTGAVVVSSSALPTGAATSTKQSDGSQKTQVVDGSGNVIGATSNALDINIKSGNPTSITANAGTNLNTSALALESGGNLAAIAGAVHAEDAASADADKGIAAMAIRKATPANTSGTDGDYEALQMSAGRLWVDPSGVTLTVATHAVTNAGTFAVQATEADGANTTLGAKADAKSTATDTTAVSVMSVLKQISASVQAPPSQAVTNAGTFAVQESGTQVVADDAAFTPGTTKVVMSGYEADESSTDSVDEGDGGAARMTLDRKQIVTVYPHTAGGLSTFMASGSDGSTALTNSAQAVKASAGQVYGYYIYNPNSSAQFVHFYNTAAASVTVGTTNPLFTLTIPATQAANLMSPHGILFTNAGFSIAATSTAGGNGAPATAIDAVVWYN